MAKNFTSSHDSPPVVAPPVVAPPVVAPPVIVGVDADKGNNPTIPMETWEKMWRECAARGGTQQDLLDDIFALSGQHTRKGENDLAAKRKAFNDAAKIRNAKVKALLDCFNGNVALARETLIADGATPSEVAEETTYLVEWPKLPSRGGAGGKTSRRAGTDKRIDARIAKYRNRK